MRFRARQLTAKYGATRLHPEAIFLSRPIQTLFNKFIKQGRRTVARYQVLAALRALRLVLWRQPLRYTLLKILRRLRMQLAVLRRRRARELVSFPVPLRRNKQDVINIQTLYKAIRGDTERTLYRRAGHQLRVVTLRRRHSVLMRQRSAAMAQQYELRADIDLRWK